MPKTPFNRDVMNNAPVRKVANAAMTCLDALQVKYTPEVQAMGAAVVLLALAEHYKIPAQDIFTATKNLINAGDEQRSEFRAVKFYLREEKF